jgi:hypothetical protein
MQPSRTHAPMSLAPNPAPHECPAPRHRDEPAQGNESAVKLADESLPDDLLEFER